jgi:hypothetical protein
MKIKKYIEFAEELLTSLAEGKYVQGALYRDEVTGRITFKAYNRKPRIRLKDRIIRYLEHGWVKESADRIKVYESIPKEIGTVRMIGVLDREVKEAKDALIEREIIDFV